MAIRVDKVINADIVSATALSGSIDYEGVTPKRISIYYRHVLKGAPNSSSEPSISATISPDGGITYIGYDKLINNGGTDTPIASVIATFSVNAERFLSTSIEDVINNIKVTVTPAGAGNLSASIGYTVSVWLMAEF